MAYSSTATFENVKEPLQIKPWLTKYKSFYGFNEWFTAPAE